MIKHHCWWSCCSQYRRWCWHEKHFPASTPDSNYCAFISLDDLRAVWAGKIREWVISMMILWNVHQPYHIMPYSGRTTFFWCCFSTIFWKEKKEVHLKSNETYRVDWQKCVEILLKDLSCFKFRVLRTDPDWDYLAKHNKTTDKWKQWSSI